MGTIRVKVDVIIPPPIDVTVRITNEDTKVVVYQDSHPPSFDIPVTVPPGNYIVNVGGMNQENESTTIEVGGDFTPNKTKVREQREYFATFFGSV